jgi:predicted metalloprotease
VVKFRKGQSSDYVSDQRGRRMAGGPAIAGGGGIIALVIALFVAFAGGGGGGGGFDPGDILGQLGAPAGPVEADPNIETGTGGAADDEDEDFMRAVMNSLQDDFWPTQEIGAEFRPTTLVLFTQSVGTGCGNATSAVGPFYCPADETAYIDLEFFDELARRFGAPGQFAQAYVIAHEVGHHIQNLQGTSDQVHRAPQSQQQGAEGLSVRLELQADCYAGLWARSVFGEGSDVEITRQDVADALDAAEAIGDDRIQEQAGMGVNPETWTHGSSEQRQEWFNRGFEGGQIAQCDTFNSEI